MKERIFDPLVEEVRARGTAYTGRLGHDPQAVLADLEMHRHEHPERYVSQLTVVREIASERRN